LLITWSSLVVVLVLVETTQAVVVLVDFVQQ
jgi:hypothetical protein